MSKSTISTFELSTEGDGGPLSPEASFLNQCGEPICKCGHPKASHNSLNTQPGYSNWQCTNCVCREFQEGE